ILLQPCIPHSGTAVSVLGESHGAAMGLGRGIAAAMCRATESVTRSAESSLTGSVNVLSQEGAVRLDQEVDTHRLNPGVPPVRRSLRRTIRRCPTLRQSTDA